MAIIGVSKPYYGIYNYNTEENTVTYTQGGVMGKATEVNIEIETSEDNNLYGDNVIAETDRKFIRGTLTNSTTDLSQSVSRVILGLVEQVLESIPGITDVGVRELIYDDRQVTPYLGVGVIIKKMVNGITMWRAVILTKIMYSVPSDAATTQGESIEWQTPELTGTIMRDDTENHMWKREATFTTESQAETYLKKRLGVGVNPELGTLTVQSAAGAEEGDTAIGVTPTLGPSNHYVYQTGATVELPAAYGESVAGGSWTAWDGTAEITATNGQEIGIVEANLDNQAVAAGKTTVVANGGA